MFEGPEEEVTSAETHKETIEIQHHPAVEATPAPETQKVTKTVHIPGKPQTTTVEIPQGPTYSQQQTMYIEEIPSDMEIPEDTTYAETIEVEGKPKASKPRQVEIRVGMPRAPGPVPTTADVIKEKTTFTTITSQMHEVPEEMPQVKEGQATRTTTIVFEQQPGMQPRELTVQVPEKPIKSDIIDATQTSTTTVTKEVRIQEVEDTEQVPEMHTETIEITKDVTQPQEVELMFKVPKDQEMPAVTFDTEEPTATKHIEVEIKEAVMQQKPKPVEIKIPKTEKSVTEITMKGPAPQVDTQRPEVEQIEETRPTIEKVTHVIPEKAKPKMQEVVFEIPGKPEETAEEVVPMETETPAPSQPEEVVEREIITVKPVAETKAPELEMKISERDTIQIVKEPMEETVQLEIEVSETAPEVTETVTTETISERTVVEEEVPQVEETHREEITFDIKGKPMEEMQLSFQIQPQEKQVPEAEEIKTVERISETITETIQLPESEETPRKEVPVLTEETPGETVTMTIDVKEVETTEIEEVATTEETDITKDTEMSVPSVTETHMEEVTLDIKGKPREEIQLSFKVDDKEKQVPEITQVRDIEHTTTVVSETIEVPQVEETERKEMPVDITDIPLEEVTMTIQIGEKEVPEVTETTQVETTEITKTFAVEVPEVEEKHKEEITIDTQEKPMEAVQFQIQIGESEVPETTVVTDTETTTETVSKTIELATVEETHRDEITLDISQKPETIQMEIDIPTEVEETISLTTEVTEEAPAATAEVRETTKEEITLEIKGTPVEMKEMEIKIPVRPKEETEASPKQTSPLTAPTTEEIFDGFEEGGPEFTWGLVNLKVMDGEEAKFRCEVEASPTPEISWFHDEKPIAENQDFRLVDFLI